MQVLELRSKIVEFWRSSQDVKRLLIDSVERGFVLIFAAYIIASIASSIAVSFIGGTAMKRRMVAKQEVERVRIGKDTNYRDVRKVIVERNIFNSAGAFPDEVDPTLGGAGNAFNPDDKCQKATVNVELLGIIHTGQIDTTFATILEKGYNGGADIYRAGDRLIGQEQALIYAITEGSVVLNNNGVKECLELMSLLTEKKLSPLSGTGVAAGSALGSGADEGGGADCPSGTVSFESQSVEESLGPGFSKILEAGRLVPHHKENAMIGFKLIGVRGGSLWTRANLNSGDVITAVNGTSMAQPEKGFAVYEALQSDKQIRVDYLKGGKSPCTLNISIK